MAPAGIGTPSTPTGRFSRPRILSPARLAKNIFPRASIGNTPPRSLTPTATSRPPSNPPQAPRERKKLAHGASRGRGVPRPGSGQRNDRVRIPAFHRRSRRTPERAPQAPQERKNLAEGMRDGGQRSEERRVGKECRSRW